MVLIPKSLQNKQKISKCVLKVGSSEIDAVHSVCNLGSVFDANMCMDKNVSSVLRSAYYQLRRIGKIRSYLDRSTCARVVHSLVTSRIDYNNSLLTGLPTVLIKRLQILQNHAARLVTQTRLRQHITPVLRSLHWLPISQRIVYKILTITYKCVHECGAPVYLQELLLRPKSIRTLRSSLDVTRLVVPRCIRTDGEKAFSIFAPKMWNQLPDSLRAIDSLVTFKKHLKTHLFGQYYNM